MIYVVFVYTMYIYASDFKNDFTMLLYFTTGYSEIICVMNLLGMFII